MRVAIIGAGAAGLACLHEFERLGVQPDVFEQQNDPGETFPMVTATLDQFYRFIPEFYDHVRDQYGLQMQPLNPLSKFVLHAPHKKAVVKGHLGWLVERGQSLTAIKTQLHSQTNTPIQFNIKKEMNDIQQEYDHVVIATGNSRVAKKQKLWRSNFIARIRLSTVIGKFSDSTVHMWLNTDYAKTGYVYLAPFSTKRACLIMIVPQVGFDELNDRWQFFLQDSKFPFEIVERHDLDFETGHVSTMVKDNLYFTGNAAGLVESLIGVGLPACVMSGIQAAQAIVKGLDLNKLMARYTTEVIRLGKIRRAMDRCDNATFDKLVSYFQKPLFQQLVYHSHLDVVRAGDLAARLFLVQDDWR